MASTSPQKFKTKILQAGKTATGIEIPATIVEALGSGQRPPVQVTINGYKYRSTIAVMGGKFMVGVNADVREASGVAGGQIVDVAIAVDTAPREVTVPPELRKAFGGNPKAKAVFDQLSYSKKRLLTVPIEKAKTDETRERNLAKALTELSNSRK